MRERKRESRRLLQAAVMTCRLFSFFLVRGLIFVSMVTVSLGGY